jgi:hypothetical protein
MASEELLSSCNNVSDHNSSSKREEHVLIVWMQDKSTVHSTLEANNCLNI